MKKFLDMAFTDNVVDFLTPDYEDFERQKGIYLKNRTEDNYLDLTFAYAGLDAGLKDLLSRGVLTTEEFQHIRDRLREGL